MKKRVMVVDDSLAMEMQISKLLEGSGFEVAAFCEDGETAIARYNEVQPDIVTMDIIMPGIIIEEHPDARIIMVSSLGYDDTVNEAMAIGAKTLLYKPIDRVSLLGALDLALT